MSKRIAVGVCVAMFAGRLHAADTKQGQSDYDLMQKWQYATAPVPLAEPVTVRSDSATWSLTSGSVYLAQPLSSGHVTGLVWQGQGRFHMSVPDRFELAQLRRFTQKPSLETIDEPITDLVLRVSDDTIDKLFAAAPRSGSYASNAVAEKRQNHWLIDLHDDVDARIVGAMANAGGRHLTAGFKTEGWDWLTYDYDSGRDEEIELIRFDRGTPEVWLSLDRAEDRTQNGRPGTRESRAAKLRHIDVKADLRRYGRAERIGQTGQRTLNGHYVIEEELMPTIEGASALTLLLDPMAQNLTVRDERGASLLVLRDHLGARTTNFDRKLYDPNITLVFARPLAKSEVRHVAFEYDLETANYALGNTWYPTVPEAFDDHTARLQLTVNKKNEVRSMGHLDSQKEDETGKTTTWIVDRPTMMVTFCTAERFEEVPLQVGGIPTVVSFGWATGLDVGTRIRNSGADVVNSLQFFQTLLDSPIGGDRFYVTSIIGNHGQAFDGFLHLGESSYSEHPGASELFRAHEVAHEWFGHRVGWRTYRDQWLSEAFAEYGAMLFVQSTVKDGPKYFNEILDVYDDLVKGDIRGMFSKFNRPWLIETSSSRRARLGPIGHGFRAGTADIPFDYEMQTYHKGPLVLHMLREILLARTHNDDLFIRILRDYVHEFSGKLATTADFQGIVEHDAPADWSWFFNDWIYGAEIPTVHWSYKVERTPAGYKLSLNIRRSDTSPDFAFLVPVRVEFDGNKSATFLAAVKSNEQTITRDLPMEPRSVVFAPDHSLLANIKKD